MFISSKSSRGHRAGWAVVASLILAVSLTACASTADNANEADLEDTTQATYEDWSLKFENCMRDEGVDLPRSDAGGKETLGTSQGDPGVLEKAQKTCITKVGEPPVQEGAPSNEEMNEIMLAFAKCVREAGYEYPDPQPISGDNALTPAIDISDIDPAVLNACATEAGFSEAATTP